MSGESEDSGNYDDDDTDVEEAMDDDEEDDNDSVSRSPPRDPHGLSDDSDDDDRPLVFKRPRVQGTDRLSTLPESLILHVLSFLPIRDSIRTGALSRRWQYLWTHVPTLNLSYRDTRRRRYSRDESDDRGEIVAPPGVVNFVGLVDKTLVLCDGSVKNLSVKFPYRTRFASRNGVEKFELVFDEAVPARDDDIYVLPQFLYTNSVFRELRFSFCRVEPKATVAWNSLKKLSIGYVNNLSEDVIQKILAGTPVLEMLELYHFRGIKRLHIGNSSVKKLILTGSHSRGGSFEPMELEISAPDVQSLEISGNFPNCQLVDIKSLVEAKLSDLFLASSFDYYSGTKARCLLDSLAHVETLTLGSWTTEGLAILHTKRLSPRLLKCKCLTWDTTMWKSFPIGTAVLLRYFPLLQTLTVIASTSHTFHGSGLYSPIVKVEEEFSAAPIPFTGFMLLRTVKVVDSWDYGAPGDPVEFVPIVLKNARNLQKMIIHMGTRNSRYRDPNKLFKATQKLLSFPRSSPDAQLLVYE